MYCKELAINIVCVCVCARGGHDKLVVQGRPATWAVSLITILVLSLDHISDAL